MMRPPPPPEPAAPASTVTATAVVSAAGAAGTVAATSTISPAAYAHCKDVAEQRMRDAAANGYDEPTQQQVFAGTFKNCAAWAIQHP